MRHAGSILALVTLIALPAHAQLAAKGLAKRRHAQVGLAVVDDLEQGLIVAGIHLILAVDRLHHEAFQAFHPLDLAAFTFRAMALRSRA